MNFAAALKSTNAPARIASIMLALSVIARILNASGKRQTFATECRVFWILSISGVTAPHHLPKRLEMAGAILGHMEVYPVAGAVAEEALPEVRKLVNELRAIVDEIQTAMAAPAPAAVEAVVKPAPQAMVRGGSTRVPVKQPEVMHARPRKGEPATAPRS